jgi:L-aminopeptidase/D-esterase-like protein
MSRFVVMGRAVLVLCMAGTPAIAPAQGVPRITIDGPSIDIDFPGLLIGTAEYDEGPTGVTVLYFPNRVKGAVDVRGGSPGTVNTDALRLGYEDHDMGAIVLAGSSWHGLSAITGVADEIRAMRTDSVTAPQIWGVAGAIINDIGSRITRRRFTTVTADDRLGRAALRAAKTARFYIGAHGAGRFAMTGGSFGVNETSGEGAAFGQIGPTKIAVFTVVNAAGLVVDRDGQIVRCRAIHWGEKCGSIRVRLKTRIDTLSRVASTSESVPSDNTTISLVVTNQKLPWYALNRLATQVHTSMARAIQPFATMGDGDVLYAVTTDEVDNPSLSLSNLGVAAGELMWDAILSSVPKGDSAIRTSAVQNSAPLDRYVGEYELGAGARVTITRAGDHLVARTAWAGMYFTSNADVPLVQLSVNEFLIDLPRHDVVRFEQGRLVINPGNWSVRAQRVR